MSTSPTDAFDRGLDRRDAGSDDLLRFASRIDRIANTRVPADVRRSVWNTVLEQQPAARTGSFGGGPISQPESTRRHSGWNRNRTGILPARMPAPAVIFLAAVLAIAFAFSGFGNDGHDIVTPTVHAQQPATVAATPETGTATPTIAIATGTP